MEQTICRRPGPGDGRPLDADPKFSLRASSQFVLLAHATLSEVIDP